MEFEECGELKLFVAAGKAVFAVDHRTSVADPSKACRTHRKHGLDGLDGLIKDEPPTEAYREACA
ncbi:hypothetical protein GCM10010349_28420 [Streptomyces flavofungini]|nr:hypothetical protein GCM10010349_28420 [Streptomyces flavofungini]